MSQLEGSPEVDLYSLLRIRHDLVVVLCVKAGSGGCRLPMTLTLSQSLNLSSPQLPRVPNRNWFFSDEVVLRIRQNNSRERNAN